MAYTSHALFYGSRADDLYLASLRQSAEKRGVAGATREASAMFFESASLPHVLLEATY